jgi:hypothetical protein
MSGEFGLDSIDKARKEKKSVSFKPISLRFAAGGNLPLNKGIFTKTFAATNVCLTLSRQPAP